MASWARESPQAGSTGKTRDCEGSVWLGRDTQWPGSKRTLFQRTESKAAGSRSEARIKTNSHLDTEQCGLHYEPEAPASLGQWGCAPDCGGPRGKEPGIGKDLLQDRETRRGAGAAGSGARRVLQEDS